MRKVGNFLFGLMFGAFLGSVLAMLFAPSSGEDLRTQAQQRVGEFQTRIKSAAAERRAELEQQLASLRQPKA